MFADLFTDVGRRWHLMRRRHGGRRARVRGTAKVAADFSVLAAAVNLARLGMLGLRHTGRGWAAAANMTTETHC